MTYATIPQAIEEVKKGKMLILFDSTREKEADFYIPSDKVTPEVITTMIKKGGGVAMYCSHSGSGP